MTNKPIMVRMTKELKDSAEKIAKDKGISLSELIRFLLVKEIENETK